MAKKNFYVIKGDKNSDIFDNWPDTQKALKNEAYYGKRVQKGFVTREEAELFMKGTDDNGIYLPELKRDDVLYAYTDGTFNSDAELSGFGLVFVKNLDIIKEMSGIADKKYNEQQQISGECKAAMLSLLTVKNEFKDVDELVIVHDLEHINGWANGWKTNNDVSKMYAEFMSKTLSDIKKERPGFKLTFVKVPSHTNISFNERADVLADKATR